MVKEALYERANLLEIAPHLSSPLPIVSAASNILRFTLLTLGFRPVDAASLQVVANSILLGRN